MADLIITLVAILVVTFVGAGAGIYIGLVIGAESMIKAIKKAFPEEKV